MAFLYLPFRYAWKVLPFRAVLQKPRHICSMQATKSGQIQVFLAEIFSPEDEGPVANSEKKCKSFCSFYKNLMPEEKNLFLQVLSKNYGVHHARVIQISKNMLNSVEEKISILKAEEQLHHALIPRYKMLFTNISRIEGGVKFLVDMRGDLIHALTQSGVNQGNLHLRVLNYTLKDLLVLWFSVGLLNLQRITWQSPCDMVQKISQYEAVHPVRNWTDLKHRVGAYRRCFVFIHNSMPREPVVVLHTALTNEIPSSIHSIIKSPMRRSTPIETFPLEEQSVENINQISTAVFYSITSTQKGLQGVDLGNYLIKRVVRELQIEFPQMCNFTSLSPIPGFKEWLIKEITKTIQKYQSGEGLEMSLFSTVDVENLKSYFDLSSLSGLEQFRKMLQLSSWANDEHLIKLLERPLMRLCARYLYVEKRRGYALNPVANFHLGNGAVLWRLNWLGDMTPRGLGQSCGMMVNYRYFLDATEQNGLNYLEKKLIEASPQFINLISICKTEAPSTEK